MCKNNEVEIIRDDIADLAGNTRSGLLDASTDNILYLAERADEFLTAMKKIMTVALKVTTENDWTLIGGKPYLQETGATKVARLFGISWQKIGLPLVEADNLGYKTFTYTCRFYLRDQFVECDGSRSMKDDFFAKGKNGVLKKPDEIDERDVKQSAYTNCINNGIKRLIPGLRGIDVKTLNEAGLNVEKIQGYTFKTGSKGGKDKNNAEESGLTCSVCGKPVSQSVASYSQANFGKMLCMDCQRAEKGDGNERG